MAFAAYWATLSRGALGGDAGELQFVPPILGLTHPTGYPLQVLLHKAWSVVPIGTVAYRLNLLDAAIAAAAVSMVAACGWRLTRRWAPALLAGATFAYGELWWSQAVSGDKYTLNGLFLALVLFLFLRWRDRRDERSLGALALLYGLSLTHHRSMLLVFPALATGLVLEGWRPRDWRQPLQLLALGAVPLLLYLYVPWAGARGLPPAAWAVDTPGAFLEYLLDRGYTSQLRFDAALGGRLVEAAGVLLRSFGPLGVGLGLLGLGWSFRRDPRIATVLLVAWLPQAVLGASYQLESHYLLPRHWVFYLPAFLIWSLWVAAGLRALQRLLEKAVGRKGGVSPPSVGEGKPRPASVGLAALIAGVFLLGQGATVWARSAEAIVRAQLGAETLDGYRQDLQRSPLAERFGRLAFQAADPYAVLVCDWEQATVLWYLQQVEGQRPDVTIRYPIEALDEAVATARRAGRPLYVARSLPDLAARGVPTSVGPLLRLLPPPTSAPPPDALTVDARLEEGVSLAGVTYHGSDFRIGGVLPFTLHWRAERRLELDYAVSVRLLSSDATQTFAQHDERHPALGASPTSQWPPGNLVGDYHELPLGNRLGPGPYRVAVVMYRSEPIQNLRRLDPPEIDFVVLPSIQIAARQPSVLDPLLRVLGR